MPGTPAQRPCQRTSFPACTGHSCNLHQERMCDAQKCWCRASRGDTPASDSLRPGDTTLGHSPRQAVKWKNASLLSSWGPGAHILGGQTCARPLKKKPYSKIRWTSFHGSSAAISETWRDTSLKCMISCLWRSLRDLARRISVRYLQIATSLVVTHQSLVSMLTAVTKHFHMA